MSPQADHAGGEGLLSRFLPGVGPVMGERAGVISLGPRGGQAGIPICPAGVARLMRGTSGRWRPVVGRP
jgi:hypothetical protein